MRKGVHDIHASSPSSDRLTWFLGGLYGQRQEVAQQGCAARRRGHQAAGAGGGAPGAEREVGGLNAQVHHRGGTSRLRRLGPAARGGAEGPGNRRKGRGEEARHQVGGGPNRRGGRPGPAVRHGGQGRPAHGRAPFDMDNDLARQVGQPPRGARATESPTTRQRASPA